MPDTPPTVPPAGTPPPAPSSTPPAAASAPPPVPVPPAPSAGSSSAPGNLLSDPPAPPAPPPGAPPPAPAAPKPEDVDAYVAAIPAVDLGTDPSGQKIELDAGAVKAIAPALLKHGVKAEQAKDVIAAYGEYIKAQASARAQEDQQFIAGLVSASKAKFGADLPRFIDDAKRGGAALFGQELWSQLVAVPALSNDARFIEAIAGYGRGIKTDDGAGKPGGGSTEKPLAERWIKSSQPK